MSPPAAQLRYEFCFVRIRPILTNLFSVEHFCPLNIRFNRALKALDLDSNNLGNEGARVLCEALKHNTTLESLNVGNRNGSSSGDTKDGGARYFADMLKVNRALTSLNLWNNQIGAGGAKAIAGSLPQS